MVYTIHVPAMLIICVLVQLFQSDISPYYPRQNFKDLSFPSFWSFFGRGLHPICPISLFIDVLDCSHVIPGKVMVELEQPECKIAKDQTYYGHKKGETCIKNWVFLQKESEKWGIPFPIKPEHGVEVAEACYCRVEEATDCHLDKQPIINLPYTVIDPPAVVIKIFDTPVTSPTMLRKLLHWALAQCTLKLEIWWVILHAR